jgi:hypothetical protein
MATPKPVFEFRQCVKLLKATGQKARNLEELCNLIDTISVNSIYHHVYEYPFKLIELEYTNDFAHWAGEVLEARALSEALSNIDPYRFPAIEDLRRELIREINEFIKGTPAYRQMLSPEEFYFNETVTFVFPAGARARNLAEFLLALRFVDPSSIYYHFFEARNRVGVNDFSAWLKDALGREELASKLFEIDLLMHTVENIRGLISDIIQEELKKEIEVSL